MSNTANVFGAEKQYSTADNEQQTEKLYAQIGQLKVENDFRKKSYWNAFNSDVYEHVLVSYAFVFDHQASFLQRFPFH
jgi:hypothetical protein